MRSNTYHFSSLHEKSNQSNLWIYLEIFSHKMTALDGFIRFHARRTLVNQREHAHTKIQAAFVLCHFFVMCVFLFLLFGSTGHRLDDTCRNTTDHGIRRYVFCNNRAGCQHRIIAHPHTGQNGDMRTNPNAPANVNGCGTIVRVSGDNP